jgi:uncharacterized protein YcbX
VVFAVAIAGPGMAATWRKVFFSSFLALSALSALTLAIGDEVAVGVALPDPRCVMPSLAQEDLPANPDILKALVRHIRIGVAGTLYPCVGVYAVAEATGTLHKGDRVSLA